MSYSIHSEGQSPLSQKERDILEYIIQRSQSSVPPSVREICAALGYKSTSTAHKYLAMLEEKGYLEKESGKNRSIKLKGDSSVQVPLLGTVAAGQPILAEQNIEGYFPIPTEYMPNAEAFMLKVKGESMINAGIFDGDQILVEKCSSARNGDMVVALVDDSATVKTFYKEGNHIRLQPENDTMDPIIVDDCEIMGKVFGVFRFF